MSINEEDIDNIEIVLDEEASEDMFVLKLKQELNGLFFLIFLDEKKTK